MLLLDALSSNVNKKMLHRVLSVCGSVLGSPYRSLSTVIPNPAKYEALKACTSKRWMYNNDIQLGIRKLDFDIDALGNAAAKASGVSQWTDMRLIAEGQFNRVLGITLDSGKEVVARLPFPNAGPPRLLVSSEVATLDFLRTRLDAPVPKVLSWNASSDSDVGTEYIIMEKCLGETLPLDKPAPGSTIIAVQTLMDLLAATPFSQYGSIYYKEDVEPSLQARPLYANSNMNDESSERFRIGPSADRRFYRGGRDKLAIDRGPWIDPLSYIKAIAYCEIEWIRTSAGKDLTGGPHDPTGHLSVLRDWLHQAPTIIPQRRYCTATLSHPDMDSSDIFYQRVVSNDENDEVDYNITIADWQGASVLPLFETHVPHFVSTKNNYEKMSESFARQIGLSSEGNSEKEHYINLSQYALVEGLAEDPVVQTTIDLYTVLKESRFQQLRQTTWYSSNVWPDNLSRFEKCLIDLARASDESIPASSDHPISPLQYSAEEIEENQKKVADFYMEKFYFQRLQDLLESRGILVAEDGAVAAEDCDKAKTQVEDMRRWLLSTFSDDDAKTAISQRWLFREGKFDPNLQVCK